MTEVDPEPEKALSDAAQAIDIQTFGEIAKKSKEIFENPLHNPEKYNII